MEQATCLVYSRASSVACLLSSTQLPHIHVQIHRCEVARESHPSLGIACYSLRSRTDGDHHGAGRACRGQDGALHAMSASIGTRYLLRLHINNPTLPLSSPSRLPSVRCPHQTLLFNNESSACADNSLSRTRFSIKATQSSETSQYHRLQCCPAQFEHPG